MKKLHPNVIRLHERIPWKIAALPKGVPAQRQWHANAAQFVLRRWSGNESEKMALHKQMTPCANAPLLPFARKARIPRPGAPMRTHGANCKGAGRPRRRLRARPHCTLRRLREPGGAELRQMLHWPRRPRTELKSDSAASPAMLTCRAPPRQVLLQSPFLSVMASIAHNISNYLLRCPSPSQSSLKPLEPKSVFWAFRWMAASEQNFHGYWSPARMLRQFRCPIVNQQPRVGLRSIKRISTDHRRYRHLTASSNVQYPAHDSTAGELAVLHVLATRVLRRSVQPRRRERSSRVTATKPADSLLRMLPERALRARCHKLLHGGGRATYRQRATWCCAMRRRRYFGPMISVALLRNGPRGWHFTCSAKFANCTQLRREP